MSGGKSMLAAVTAIMVVPAMVMAMMMAGGNSDDKKSKANAGGVPTSVPEEYRDVVGKAGSICPEITPSIIAAQVQQESNWDPEAGSPAGAAGIAQFMPATWEGAGKDGDGDGRADILNPIDSIYSQGHYMCAMVEGVRALASGADEIARLALAAYNAGLGAVEAYGGVPPYSETTNYVSIIMATAAELASSTSGGGDGGDRGATILATARSKIGLPYVWGAAGPDSYDCSGLVMEAYQSAGIELPHSSGEQCSAGSVVSKNEAAPGDLVCWDGHVALWAGEDKIVEAAQEGTPLRETTIYTMSGGPYFVHID